EGRRRPMKTADACRSLDPSANGPAIKSDAFGPSRTGRGAIARESGSEPGRFTVTIAEGPGTLVPRLGGSLKWVGTSWEAYPLRARSAPLRFSSQAVLAALALLPRGATCAAHAGRARASSGRSPEVAELPLSALWAEPLRPLVLGWGGLSSPAYRPSE